VRPDVDVTVSWQPFMIDPRTASEGEDYSEYCKRRWGGDGWTRSLRTAGERDGLAFANWRTWPNTLHANRLLMYAEEFGLGGEVKSVLMRMIYEEGENGSLKETVARAADEVGVPGGATHVHSDAGVEQLRAALQGAAVNGKRVSGVPYYVVNDGALDFSGAQETKQWVKIFEHFAGAGQDGSKAAAAAAGGESC